MIKYVIETHVIIMILTSNRSGLNSIVERQGLTNVIIKAWSIPVLLFFCLYLFLCEYIIWPPGFKYHLNSNDSRLIFPT